MKISVMVAEIWGIQECLEKINQRGITRKLRKRKQSFLCRTHCLDLIYVSIKLQEDIPNVFGVMECHVIKTIRTTFYF